MKVSNAQSPIEPKSLLIHNLGFRLLMPADRNMRLYLKDCVISTGCGPQGKAPVFVPRGTQVSVNFGAMQRQGYMG